MFDGKTGAARLTLSGHIGWVNSAAFSPDGPSIVTASFDKTAIVWDATPGTLGDPRRAHRPGISAAFSPDGERVVTASLDKTAPLWDAKPGRLAHLAGQSMGVSPAFSRTARHRQRGG